MTHLKSYTSLEQSKVLAEILPLESADMYYHFNRNAVKDYFNDIPNFIQLDNHFAFFNDDIPCWSLAALLGVLPEINGIPLTLEKVKAEYGYEGYYYHIEYKGIVLIPYPKNPIDACYEMIIKLYNLNLL